MLRRLTQNQSQCCVPALLSERNTEVHSAEIENNFPTVVTTRPAQMIDQPGYDFVADPEKILEQASAMGFPRITQVVIQCAPTIPQYREQNTRRTTPFRRLLLFQIAVDRKTDATLSSSCQMKIVPQFGGLSNANLARHQDSRLSLPALDVEIQPPEKIILALLVEGASQFRTLNRGSFGVELLQDCAQVIEGGQ